MLATPENVRTLGSGLDHPEGVCIDPAGTVYAGGELGQLYRITADGQQTQIASTGGFLLGLALDAEGSVHACDVGRKAVVRIDPDGSVHERSRGVPERLFEEPNYPAFDPQGNLYVSESGDYWNPEGTGAVMVIRPDNTTEMFHAGPLLFANGLAVDPTATWLYVVQSRGPNVARIALDRPNGPVESTHTLPVGTVPDGLVFAADGRLVITCYKPDIVYVGHPDGGVEVLVEDLTGELISRPTNGALYNGKLYLANIGGWHISVIETDMQPAGPFRPSLRHS